MPEWKQWQNGNINGWEWRFLTNIINRKKLTPKQQAKILEIARQKGPRTRA